MVLGCDAFPLYSIHLSQSQKIIVKLTLTNKCYGNTELWHMIRKTFSYTKNSLVGQKFNNWGTDLNPTFSFQLLTMDLWRYNHSTVNLHMRLLTIIVRVSTCFLFYCSWLLPSSFSNLYPRRHAWLKGIYLEESFVSCGLVFKEKT